MRNSETAVIDGEQYTITMLHPDPAMEVWCWLMNRFGGSLVKVFKGMKGKSFSELLNASMKDAASELDWEDIGMELVRNINGDEVKINLRKLVSTVLYKGHQIQYDVHFIGRPGHLMRVAVKAIQVNFADFFSASQGGSVHVRVERDSTQVQRM